MYGKSDDLYRSHPGSERKGEEEEKAQRPGMVSVYDKRPYEEEKRERKKQNLYYCMHRNRPLVGGPGTISLEKEKRKKGNPLI